MTDLDKLKTLLTEFGVHFDESVGVHFDESGNVDHQYVTCTEGDAKVVGYRGFITDFVFDNDGRFVEMGASE